MNSKVTALLARLALVVTAVVWGSSLTVVSAIKDAFTPNMLLALRFSIACVLLAIIFAPHLKKLNKDYILSGLIVGFFLFIAYSSQTIGVTSAEGAPGRSGFISASYCVIVPFWAWLFTGEVPDRYNIIAAVLCVIGLFFVFYTELVKSANISFSQGDLYALLSGLLSLFALGYLAIMCTAVALLFQTIGQRYTPASTVALILGTEAVFSILFAVLFAGEKLTWSSVAGFVLIFLAIIVSETKMQFLKKKQ